MGAGERPTDGVMAYHRACAVRNSVVDCEYKVNPVPISGITFSGSTATVTTQVPHGRAVNDWVRVAGALVNGSLDNPFNGSFKITVVPTTTQFQYTMASTPSAAPVGDMWVGRFPSHYVAISAVTPSGTSPGPWTITVDTSTPHFLVPGSTVVVNNVNSPNPSPINGIWIVSNVVNSKKFEFQMSTDPGSVTSLGSAFIGVNFQSLSADGGTNAVVEGNRILNTRFGGPYHDTWSTKDLIVRNNYYRAVVTGPYQNLSFLSYSHTSDMIALAPPTPLTHSGPTGIATTNSPHGFSAGPPADIVIISGVTGPTQQDADWYNGQFPITAVPDSTHFNYGPMGGSPSGAATGSPGYATVDQQRLLASLTSSLQSGAFVATAQISTSYTSHGFAIGDAVKISKASRTQYNGYFTITAIPDATRFQYTLPSDPVGASISGYYGRLWQAGRVLIENNVIELVPTPTNWGFPAAILLGYGSFVSPPLFRQVVIRGNVIRHVDGASDPPGMVLATGIWVLGCGELIVEDNVVDLDRAIPIEYSMCGNVRFFNNRTSAGVLLQGNNTDVSMKTSELPTDIEDALFLAF